MPDQWPRQPRAGLSANKARRVAGSGTTHKVQCRTSNGSSWVDVAVLQSQARADTMVTNLNEVFDNHPGADLDFIHIYKGGPSINYAVVWPTVTFAQQHAFFELFQYNNCSTDAIKAWQQPYKHDNVRTIQTVNQADADWYGKPPWRVAFTWANNIRNVVNGWNMSKDAFYTANGNQVPLCHTSQGFIAVFPTATNRSAAPESFNSACVYGFGECLNGFCLAFEIFHCLDLTVAAPNDEAGQARWAKNQWVQVSIPGASVRARINNKSGCNKVELSRGVVRALGATENGLDVQNVTISDP